MAERLAPGCPAWSRRGPLWGRGGRAWGEGCVWGQAPGGGGGLRALVGVGVGH